MLHKELWEQLNELSAERTGLRAGCRCEIKPVRYILTLLNREFIADVRGRRIYRNEKGCEVEGDFLEQLCILAYLINSKQIPLSNKLVKGESLPGGAFFFRGPHELPVARLTEAFGAEPELIYRGADALNLKKRPFGDASVEVLVLPRLPVTFVLWRGDDEFPARSSILFDGSGGEHMVLDGLLAAVNLAVTAVIKACCGENQGDSE